MDILHPWYVEMMNADEIRRAVRLALEEDIGAGDATTLATVPEKAVARAAMVAREPLVVAGLELAKAVFVELSGSVRFEGRVSDGEQADPGRKLLEVHGPARPILSAERVALNFVQRLSGVATITDQFVAAVNRTRAEILDTRKTTPGWRRLEKYAVRCGGRRKHRLGPFARAPLKDNQLA